MKILEKSDAIAKKHNQSFQKLSDALSEITGEKTSSNAKSFSFLVEKLSDKHKAAVDAAAASGETPEWAKSKASDEF